MEHFIYDKGGNSLFGAKKVKRRWDALQSVDWFIYWIRGIDSDPVQRHSDDGDAYIVVGNPPY